MSQFFSRVNTYRQHNFMCDRDVYYLGSRSRSKKMRKNIKHTYIYYILFILLSPILLSEAKAENITFAQAVEAAWAADPSRTELNTNYRSAAARAEAAGSWFAGGPTVSGQYFDDHAIGSNEGYTTYQGGVSVPLWLPGQGSATVGVARAEALTIQERLHVARMTVAMKVLDSSANVIIAKRWLAIARIQKEMLEKIHASVSRGVHAGEMPLADQQIVSSEVANAASEYSLAEEQVKTATSALHILLGRPATPDILSFNNETLARDGLASTEALENSDPRVKAARQAVHAAEAGVHLAKTSFMPNPEVGAVAIHEKQYGSPWDDRVGVTVSIPLPSDVRDVPMEADARNKLAAAISQEQQARRNVRQELTQVFSHLTATKDMFRNSVLSAESMNNRANEMSRSWQAGETSLVELLRARSAAYNALQRRNQTEIAWHVAIIRTLIAAGEFQ
ncbi:MULTISPECIES: TolC family protein [Acetobacteraceae]|uniref:TolC family protein n=1 Tax=Acetobacteraceae TaxID=433 RepID=UPI00207B7606|nr:TolC family protein [Acidomonas methanolica]